MNKIIKLESVNQYNSLYGLETLHPLVSVVDLTKATKSINHIQMKYGLYALFLKETKSCDIKYGRQYYVYRWHVPILSVSFSNSPLQSFST